MSASTLKLPDGAQIAFDLRGPVGAPSLLLLRPAGGSMHLWGRFREICAGRLRVLSFDPRGEGDSSRAPLLWSVEAMVKDTLALLDHVEIAQTHVFGISMGGMVATRLAIDHPHRVDRLILASTVAYGHAPGLRATLAGARIARCLLERDGAVQPCQVEGTTLHDNPSVAAAAERARELPTQRRALLSYAVAALRHDVRRQLGRIRAPTLVLGGSHDPLTPPRVARRLASRISGAEVCFLEGGHDLTLDCPEATARMVLTFLIGAPERHQPSTTSRGEATP